MTEICALDKIIKRRDIIIEIHRYEKDKMLEDDYYIKSSSKTWKYYYVD